MICLKGIYKVTKETYRDLVKRNELAINQNATEENQRLIRDFLYNQVRENHCVSCSGIW